jgi:hypothetical protein
VGVPHCSYSSASFIHTTSTVSMLSSSCSVRIMRDARSPPWLQRQSVEHRRSSSVKCNYHLLCAHYYSRCIFLSGLPRMLGRDRRIPRLVVYMYPAPAPCCAVPMLFLDTMDDGADPVPFVHWRTDASFLWITTTQADHSMKHQDVLSFIIQANKGKHPSVVLRGQDVRVCLGIQNSRRARTCARREAAKYSCTFRYSEARSNPRLLQGHPLEHPQLFDRDAAHAPTREVGIMARLLQVPSLSSSAPPIWLRSTLARMAALDPCTHTYFTNTHGRNVHVSIGPVPRTDAMG